MFEVVAIISAIAGLVAVVCGIVLVWRRIMGRTVVNMRWDGLLEINTGLAGIVVLIVGAIMIYTPLQALAKVREKEATIQRQSVVVLKQSEQLKKQVAALNDLQNRLNFLTLRATRAAKKKPSAEDAAKMFGEFAIGLAEARNKIGLSLKALERKPHA